jgi:hypothetical protein
MGRKRESRVTTTSSRRDARLKRLSLFMSAENHESELEIKSPSRAVSLSPVARTRRI